MVLSNSKIDEVWSKKLREKIEGRYGRRKNKEREWCVTLEAKVMLLYLIFYAVTVRLFIKRRTNLQFVFFLLTFSTLLFYNN